MRNTLKLISEKSHKVHDTMERKDWLKMDPSQVTLLINLMNWVTNVETAMKKNSMAQ
jgi:hypothetical protein